MTFHGDLPDNLVDANNDRFVTLAWCRGLTNMHDDVDPEHITICIEHAYCDHTSHLVTGPDDCTHIQCQTFWKVDCSANIPCVCIKRDGEERERVFVLVSSTNKEYYIELLYLRHEVPMDSDLVSFLNRITKGILTLLNHKHPPTCCNLSFIT